MNYSNIYNLPSLLQERLDRVDIVQINQSLQQKFLLSDGKQRNALLLENQLLLKEAVLEVLPELLQQKLVVDQKTAERIAVELWGNYFLLFQDFLPRVDQLIVKYGGDILGFQERTKKLLSPRRQLREFIREFLSDSSLEKASDECAGDIIEALLARIIDDETHQQFLDRVKATLLKNNLPLDPADFLVNTLEGMIATGTLSRHWALYYHDLSGNVLNAVPGKFEESEKTVEDHPDSTHSSLLFLMQSFERLAAEKREPLSSPRGQAQREELEKRFGITLEEFLIRAAVGDFPLEDLAIMIKKEYGLPPEQASILRDEIVQKFFSVSNDNAPMIIKPSSQPIPSPILPTKEEYELILGSVIAIAKVQPSDAGIEGRIRQIVMTRIKNIRSMIETKEKLVASPAVGGAGLSNDDAESLVREATRVSDAIMRGTYVIPGPPQEVKKEVKEEEVVPQLEVKEEEAKREEKPAEADREEAKIQEKPEPQRPMLAIEEIDGLPVLVEKTNQALPVLPAREPVTVAAGAPSPSPASSVLPATVSAAAPPMMIAPPPPAETPAPVKPLPPAPFAGAAVIPIVIKKSGDMPRQKVVSDIKPPSSKLVDAIEELRIMTLKDFRRLSQDPAEATRRVFQKIQLLEKESFTKKMAATEAWKESQVSTAYREMASESLVMGGQMKPVIEKRTSEGRDALTEQEFDALLELNEMLRT